MRTALSAKLTPAERERLIEFAVTRATNVDAEMTPWREKLAKYERQADNDFSDRPTAGPDKVQNIFGLAGNKSLNCVRGVARYMRGRCSGDVFGGTPWFFARAEGLDDKDLAEGIQRHLDFKLRQADFRKAGKDVIGTAIDLGTAVPKTTWKVTREPYDRLANVFCGPDGVPVLRPAPDGLGDYIEEGDEALLDDGMGNVLYQPPAAPATGASGPAVMGSLQEHLVTEPNLKYEGLNTEQISYRNLLAPMTVEKWEDADLLGHFYDRQVADLKAAYDPTGDDPDLKDVWPLLQTGNTVPRTGDKEAKRDESVSTGDADPEQRNPWVKVHELRLRFDAVAGRGVQRIYIVLHLESRSILHVDYLGNMTPNGDLDMHPVVINRVPSRWYGRGYFEVYEMLQWMIDNKLCAIIHRNNQNADPIKVLDLEATEETLVDGQLVMGPGKVLTKRKQADPNSKVLEYIELPDLDTRTWQLLELFMQILQQDSGVTAAAQGDPGALPSVSTATGVNSILSSGSTMHQLVIDELREGFEPHLSFTMRLVYSKQDKDETFSYMQGAQSTQALLAFSDAKKLARLFLDVSLTLTRIKNQQQRDAATALIPLALQYFTLAPQAMIAVRPLYLQVAKSLEIDDADSIFPLPQLPPPAPAAPALPGAPVDPQQPGAAAPQDAQPIAAQAPAPPMVQAPGGPIIPNIGTTGANPAAPLPVNVIPATASPNNGGF